jgi:hypothetical protein
MKVTFHCSTHDLQSEEEGTWDVPDDTTDEELEEMAKDYFWECKQPEWWYEVNK